jgi:multiple sugar transport system permease protein
MQNNSPIKRRIRVTGKMGEMLESYTFLAPAFVIFIFFTFIPVIWSFYLSVFNYSLLSFRAPEYVGYQNFREIFQDKVFWVSVNNTIVYALGTVPVRLALGLFIALLLNNKLFALKFYRTSYFLPVVTSMVAAGIIWSLVFDAGNAGLANRVLMLCKAKPAGWLADSKLAMLAMIIMSTWKDLGYCMLIYLAGLQGIPMELYEAADIDGTSSWQKFWHVTLPLLKPTTFFILTTQIIGAFQVFTQTYVMTGGGPGYSTTTLINLLYIKGFQEFNMGYASALAVLLFITLLLLTIFQKRVFKADETIY